MFYAVEKELTLFEVQYANAICDCDWFTRNFAFGGTKLAQILSDKYISFHNHIYSSTILAPCSKTNAR